MDLSLTAVSKYVVELIQEGIVEELGLQASQGGRKAWLFSATPAGARASSVLYSIIETAKENGLHPYRHLEFLLTVLPGAKAPELEPQLPWSESLTKHCRAPQKEGA